MTIGIDIPPVQDEQEALILMIHHLQLAAAYFEATPDPILMGDLPWGFHTPAYVAWIKAMEKLYPKD